MIDFSTLQGVTIPEGVVTQIEVGGVVLWKLKEAGLPAILEVEKITAKTYIGETAYENEQFILLDIYPETNGTVSVTYGGLTKTVTDTSGAEEPNVQQVFFGTFNGVSDSVATPASGTLTVEGALRGFASGVYHYNSKGYAAYFNGIRAVTEFGSIEELAPYAFYGYSGQTIDELPEGLMKIGDCAFYNCFAVHFNDNLLKEGLTSIGSSAFTWSQASDNGKDPASLQGVYSLTIPSTVTYIGSDAFDAPIEGSRSYTQFKKITVLAENPPEYGGTTSSDFGGLFCEIKGGKEFSIVVPKGCAEAYKAAEHWNWYADYIVEAS